MRCDSMKESEQSRTKKSAEKDLVIHMARTISSSNQKQRKKLEIPKAFDIWSNGFIEMLFHLYAMLS